MTTDNFPIDCDYPFPIPKMLGVLRGGVKGGKEFRRRSVAPQRVWRLQFRSRPVTDWDSVEQFAAKVGDDFFTWTEPIHNRVYSVTFGSDPQYNPAANQSIDIAVELVEAVGVALATYPTLPLVAIDPSRFKTVGTTTKVIIWGGYGFQINQAGATDMKLDGVSLGVVANKFDVPLDLHRLEVIGAGVPAVASCSFVM